MKHTRTFIVATGTILVIVLLFVFAFKNKTATEDVVVLHKPESEGIVTDWLAEKFFTPKAEDLRLIAEPKELSSESAPTLFSITSDPALLGGEGFFYVENGVLYRNKLDRGVVIERGQKIGDGVEKIMAQDDKTVFFVRVLSSGVSSSEFSPNELWMVDKGYGVVGKIAEDVDFVDISSGENIALSMRSSEEIVMTDRQGNMIQKIGIHGSDPIFSSNNTKIAYLKLGDYAGDGDQGLGEYGFKGIAVYDLATKKEKMIAVDPNDYNPVSFSSDGKYLSYISTRDNSYTLWSASVDNLESPIRRTPEGVNLYLGRNLVWSTDRTNVISEINGVISLVHIPSDINTYASERMLAENASDARWKVQDKIIEFKGESGWQDLDVSTLLP